MAVRQPLRDIPVQITVDNVVVTGRITALYPNDITVEITSPYQGVRNGAHIPYFLMARENWLATFAGEATTAITERGRARAEGMLRELYEHALGHRVNVTFEEQRHDHWIRVSGHRLRHAKGTLPLYVSDDYCAPTGEAETFQKAGWIVESLATRPIRGCEFTQPEDLDFNAGVHRLEYVRAMQTGLPRHLAESNGFAWEPGVWRAARASNAGVVGAALESLVSRANSGSLSSGIHHARADAGAAFCTFNGLAMAARKAADDGARVLILDVDAHCGGGTHAIVRDWKHVDHVDVATSAFDGYTPASSRSTLDVVENSADYLATIRRRLTAIEPTEYDLVLYGAGVDPFVSEGPHPIDYEVLAEREATVYQWAHGHVPIAFCLLGGYLGPGVDRDGLARLHRLVVAAAALANAGLSLTRERVMEVASTQSGTEGFSWTATGRKTFVNP